MSLRRMVILVLSTTLLVSCAEPEVDPAEEAAPTAEASADPTPTPTVTVAQEPGPTFASTADAAAALKRGGMRCTDLTVLDQKDPTLKEFALCDVGSAENRLDIYLFANGENRNAWMGGIVETGFPWVFGPNWIIVGAGEPTTAEQRIQDVQEAIGGQIPDVQF